MAAESKSGSSEFTFVDHMTKIMDTLDISGVQRNTILNEMSTFNDTQKFTIMRDTNLSSLLDKLIESDKAIKNLFDNDLKSMQKDIKPQWDIMLANISKLQGYIILQKVQSGDCSAVIRSLMEALNKKIDSVNSVLKANIDSAGVVPAVAPSAVVPPASGASATKYQHNGELNDKFREKYLKYKLKYIKLKSQ
jgi:hypothetical protein